MEVFYNRGDIEQQLTHAFLDRYKRKDAALTGILLARPEDKIAKDLVLPNLEYWHRRSLARPPNSPLELSSASPGLTGRAK